MIKSREYHIVIDEGEVVVDCDTYELTYAHNGEVISIGGCKMLAEEGDQQNFQPTWLSWRAKQEG